MSLKTYFDSGEFLRSNLPKLLNIKKGICHNKFEIVLGCKMLKSFQWLRNQIKTLCTKVYITHYFYTRKHKFLSLAHTLT